MPRSTVRVATLQVCDALATPHWTREVGWEFDDADDDKLQPGEAFHWPTYVARQRASKAWGGEREMRVIQELLDVRLEVYELDMEVRPETSATLLAN
jgi:hypothetical protein